MSNELIEVEIDEGHREDEAYAEAIRDAEMEQLLASFTAEPSIQHDCYPESGDESDEGDEGHRRPAKASRKRAHERGDGNLYIGQVFFNREMFIEAVLDHALKGARNIRQTRYDQNKLVFSCVGGNCPWRVYAGTKSESSQWEIRRFLDKHLCVPNGECELLKVPVICRLFIDSIRDEPNYFMSMKMEAIVKEKWKLTVTRSQCQAARTNALKLIEREYDHQFERLRDYVEEIQTSNPDSSVAIETLSYNGLDVFNRFYICFDAVRRSWLNNCRKVIGIDGTHLRGRMKGQLLVAIGRDANNGIYPIAWGVVQVENNPNWIWFMRKLKTDLGLGEGKDHVLISDRQKGLLAAVEEELPLIEHRMCTRHIYHNLKKKHGKKKDMKLLVWNLAWSYSQATYHANLEKILEYDEGVYATVLETKPQTWCRAFYKIGSDCEDVSNNFTESFNATMVKAREMPLVPMLEMIARQAMVRIFQRYSKAMIHDGVTTPYVQDKFAEEFELVSKCRVNRGTNMMFQVMLHGCSYQVSLQARKCSCRKWDVRGFPCEHGYAAILNQRLEVENFLNHWFRTDIWRNTYTEGITPNRGALYWPRGTGAAVHRPPSPPQPGRPKKKKHKVQKRMKGVNESPTKKKDKQRIMHCKICKNPNHNSRGHKKLFPESSQGQSSQGQSSQALVSQGEGSQA